VSGIAVELGTELLPVASLFMDAFSPILNELPIILRQTIPYVKQMSSNLLPVLETTARIFSRVLPPAMKLVASVGSVAIKVLKPLLYVLELIAEAVSKVLDLVADLFISSKVPDAAGGMMSNVASTITDNKSEIVNAMGDAIASGEMDALFEAAGKRHGEIYSSFLREGVEAVKVTLSKEESLATWKTAGGKFVSASGGKDAIDEVLSRKPSREEYLGLVPAQLRAVGLNQGRSAFESQVAEAKKIAALEFRKDKSIMSDIDKIAQEQRNYLMGLANGTAKSTSSGYVFSENKKNKNGASGLSSEGVTHSGPRQVTININKEMIGELAINSYNVREGVGEMEDMVREMILRMFKSVESE
jgi:predicted Zn-ribbon and HTH transcriptional regulator